MVGLLAMPVVVLIVCAVLLVVALFWRSRARRSDGSGFVPTAFVWVALAALILSLGATAMRAVIDNGGPDGGRGTQLRTSAPESSSPSATQPASPSASPSGVPTPSPTPSAAPSSATSAPQSPPAPTPAPPAPAAPAPNPAPPAPAPSRPAPTPVPTKCAQSLTLGLLPSDNCDG
ncbi:hypothetical protein [Sinomonas sp. ASV322]|uniref:hypothetical protein n=1 Tax=Sinomonas sp. ASV322 TaxID=3041920 RepID=UPI0027DDC677|nr:hypothetical protein [Sinomonas sp. ASV322]MDQ4504057.1 hypothetical protein [Sinomonas sp. ASV322]